MFDLPPVDPIQHECLTQAIYHEARGEESYKGKLMVGFVIKERMKDPYYADTYCQVIKEPRQFSFYQGHFPTMYEADQEEYLRGLAEVVMTTPTPFPDCLTMYHADYVNPVWDYSKLEVYEQVGTHIFYIELDCKVRKEQAYGDDSGRFYYDRPDS